VNRKSTLIAGWVGILAGLALAVYLQSFLIGVPFLLFALQRYLTGGKTMELERLSLPGGIALALATTVTFGLYVFVIAATAKRPDRLHPTEWFCSERSVDRTAPNHAP